MLPSRHIRTGTARWSRRRKGNATLDFWQRPSNGADPDGRGLGCASGLTPESVAFKAVAAGQRLCVRGCAVLARPRGCRRRRSSACGGGCFGSLTSPPSGRGHSRAARRCRLSCRCRRVSAARKGERELPALPVMRCRKKWCPITYPRLSLQAHPLSFRCPRYRAVHPRGRFARAILVRPSGRRRGADPSAAWKSRRGCSSRSKTKRHRHLVVCPMREIQGHHGALLIEVAGASNTTRSDPRDRH